MLMTENKSKKLVWNKQDQQRYNALYTKLKETDKELKQDNYLYSYNKKKLQQFINKLDLSISSKESFYFMVAKWLKINKPNDTMAINFTNLGHKLKKQRDEDYSDNVLSERKQQNYRDYSYFVDILNSTDYKEIKTYRSHLQYLLLSLLIKQPPLRTSFYTSAEVHTKGGFDKQQNYIKLYTAGRPRVSFYVGRDKVSNTRYYKDDFTRNYVDVEDRELIDLIYYSVEKYPRSYLFENNGKPIQDETLLKYLREITKVDKIDVDTMRSVYISHFYNNFSLTYKEKETMARKMRHSVETAQHKYLKVVSQEKTDKAKDERIKQLEDEVKQLNEKLSNLEKERDELKNEVKTVKDEQPKDPKWRKQRYDILYKLQNNIQKTVREETLNKFNIKYNNETGKYY